MGLAVPHTCIMYVMTTARSQDKRKMRVGKENESWVRLACKWQIWAVIWLCEVAGNPTGASQQLNQNGRCELFQNLQSKEWNVSEVCRKCSTEGWKNFLPRIPKGDHFRTELPLTGPPAVFPLLITRGSNISPFREEAGLANFPVCPSQAHKENDPIQKTVGPTDPSNKPEMSSSQLT